MPSLPRSGPRSGRCALRLALAALLLSVALPAHAQQAVDGTETDSPPSMEDGDSSILLRGTLGSGDQETSLAAGAPVTVNVTGLPGTIDVMSSTGTYGGGRASSARLDGASMPTLAG